MSAFTGWLSGIGQEFYKAFIEKDRYIAYMRGMRTTLIVSFFAVLMGVVIGMIVAVIKYMAVRNKKLAIPNAICNLYIAVIRGTPVYLQMLIYGFVIFTSRDTNPLVTGIVCFGINSGAYVAEIIRAGIEAVDTGQTEAGRSLGLSWIQTMISIIMPQAFKNILPALGNEFIVLIKETAMIGVISVLDITKAAQNVGATTFNLMPPLFIAAAMYFVVVVILTYLLGILERRMAQSDRR